MANQTDRDVERVHGTNPQFLIERLTRERIYLSRFWRERCFGVSAADVAELASELTHIGGEFGGARQPTPFLCLLLKLLQLGPPRDVVDEFVRQPHFKYAAALGALYLRFVGEASDVYPAVEELLRDYRKLVVRRSSGEFELTHVDEFADDLLNAEEVFGCNLPRIQPRYICETELGLDPRVSALMLAPNPG